ncbi:hypothetical protein MMC13_002961 [Lambiella insularis]|nr:hypothetical protein [Lambiella insularis]
MPSNNPESIDSLAKSITALAADCGFGATAGVFNPDGTRNVVNTSGANNYHTYTAPAGAAGEGLFASKAFEAGELVLKLEEDVTSVLDSPKLGDVCEWCFEEQGDGEAEGVRKLRKCGGCAVVRFCDEECQKSSWRHHHKYECKTFKKLYPNVLPNTVRLLVRLSLRGLNGLLHPSIWSAFMRLQHHLDDFKSQKSSDSQGTWEDIQLMARAAKEYGGIGDEWGNVDAMVGRVLINALTLVTPTFTSLGLSLSPTAALLNHSCNPNTCISFSGPILSVRALRPIAEDTELTISYIDITNPAPIRRADLLARYFFTCTCPSCAAKPPRTLNRIDPPPALTSALPPSQLEALESRARSLIQDSLAPALLAREPAARLAPLQEALSLFAPHATYPPYRQPLAGLRAELVLALLATQQWVPALIHSLVAYFHIDPFLFPESIHPVRVVHKWVLLKLVLQVAAAGQEGDAAVRAFDARWGVEWGAVVFGLLLEVEGSVGGSHGLESGFARKVMREGEGLRGDLRGGPYGFQGPGRRDVEREWGLLRKAADGGLSWWEERGKGVADSES